MVTLTISNQGQLSALNRLPRGVLAEILRRLTFKNPQWEVNARRGFSNHSVPQEICGYRQEGDTLIIPRGFTRQIVGILRGRVQYEVKDRRRTLPEVDFTFRGELHDFQQEAVEAMDARDFGTMAAPTGSGKTIMALALIARRRQPTLIVVHNRELLTQWTSRIETFLGIPAQEVGRIAEGKMKIGGQITVALVHSLYKCAGEVAPHFGQLIVDECHRAPSRTFTEAVSAFDSRFMLGLSATLWRRDRLTRLIYWHLGDKVHEVDKDALIEAGHIFEAQVLWRPTNFTPWHDPSTQYSAMLSELTQDPKRNALIVNDVTTEAGNGSGVCLVLTDRKAHCEALV